MEWHLKFTLHCLQQYRMWLNCHVDVDGNKIWVRLVERCGRFVYRQYPPFRSLLHTDSHNCSFYVGHIALRYNSIDDPCVLNVVERRELSYTYCGLAQNSLDIGKLWLILFRQYIRLPITIPLGLVIFLLGAVDEELFTPPIMIAVLRLLYIARKQIARFWISPHSLSVNHWILHVNTNLIQEKLTYQYRNTTK